MKKFINRFFLFLLTVFILLGLFQCAVIYNRRSSLKLSPNINTLFLGNSTIECAINDSIYPNSLNMARSSELMESSYLKLKLFHLYNPQIDTVILGFDDAILYNETTVTKLNHPYFIDQMSITDLIENFKENFDSGNKIFFHIYDLNKLRQIYKSINDDYKISDLGIGGYLWLDRDKLQIDIKNHVDNHNFISPPPPLNIYYLNKIVEFCKMKDLDLILLSTPKYTPAWIDTIYRDIHRQICPEITLIDNISQLYPDSCYGDIYHLNHKGATQYSRDLHNFISQN